MKLDTIQQILSARVLITMAFLCSWLPVNGQVDVQYTGEESLAPRSTSLIVPDKSVNLTPISQKEELTVPIAKRALLYAKMVAAAYQGFESGSEILKDRGYELIRQTDWRKIQDSLGPYDYDFNYDKNSGQVSYSDDSSTEFQAVIFLNAIYSKIVIAYTGSGLVGTISHLIGSGPLLYTAAIDLASRVKEAYEPLGYDIITTGLRIGGSQAQVSALACGGKAYCFNSLGVTRSALDQAFSERNNWSKASSIDLPLPESPELWSQEAKNLMRRYIKQYNLAGDYFIESMPANLYGEQVGKIYEIPYSSQSSIFSLPSLTSWQWINLIVSNLDTYITTHDIEDAMDFVISAPPSVLAIGPPKVANMSNMKIHELIKKNDTNFSWLLYDLRELPGFEKQLNIRNAAGYTPLIEAVDAGHDNLAKILLNYDQTDVNRPDSNGVTPLMHAALKCNGPMVKLLIENGAKVDLRDKDGKTVLHYLAMGAHSLRQYLRVARYIDAQAEREGTISELYNTGDRQGKLPSDYSLLSSVREKLNRYQK